MTAVLEPTRTLSLSDPRTGEALEPVPVAGEQEVRGALAAARATPWPARWPSALRPLGMIAALARRDCEPDRPRWEPHGAPGRMWRMLRHRLSGR